MIYKNTLNDCIRSKSLPLLSLFSLPVQVSCRSVASFCGYSSLRSHHAVLGTMGTASWCGDYSLTSIFEKQSKLFKHFLYFFIFFLIYFVIVYLLSFVGYCCCVTKLSHVKKRCILDSKNVFLYFQDLID